MKRVKIDKEELFAQFEFSSIETIYYLDTMTGEVVFVSEYSMAEENIEVEDLIESQPERFIEFPSQDPRSGFNNMVDFLGLVEDKGLKDKLACALNARHPFRGFKDVLLYYPKDRQRWFAFEEKRRRERFEEWLQTEEIEIINSDMK